MARKTGEQALVQMEIGYTPYTKVQLSTVSSPSADVGKVFETSAQFISDATSRKPVEYIDGVKSGFTLTASTSYNAVDYTAGVVQMSGQEISVNAGTISDITRPTGASNYVLVTALTVDINGTINKTAGTEGVSTSTRGAAGGRPFLPVGEILIGYVYATYYQGSESGAKVLESTEIDTEQKEYSYIPGAKWTYHDETLNVGTLTLGTALPLIHAATAAGPGTARRSVFATYADAEFEEVPNAMDASFDEAVTTITSRAYGESSEEVDISTKSVSSSFTVYWTKLRDTLDVVKSDKRWTKLFPDRDETPYVAFRAIVAVNRSMPVADNMTADVTLTGSGELISKDS